MHRMAQKLQKMKKMPREMTLEDERMFSRFLQQYQHIQVGKKIKTRNIYRRNVNRTWHQTLPSLSWIDPSTLSCNLWILLHPTQFLQTRGVCTSLRGHVVRILGAVLRLHRLHLVVLLESSRQEHRNEEEEEVKCPHTHVNHSQVPTKHDPLRSSHGTSTSVHSNTLHTLVHVNLDPLHEGKQTAGVVK